MPPGLGHIIEWLSEQKGAISDQWERNQKCSDHLKNPMIVIYSSNKLTNKKIESKTEILKNWNGKYKHIKKLFQIQKTEVFGTSVMDWLGNVIQKVGKLRETKFFFKKKPGKIIH